MGLLGDFARLFRRLAGRLRRHRLDDELREEIEAHMARRRQQLVDEGLDACEAAYQARRMFGNPLALREQAQEFWSLQSLDALALDARFAFRLLRRRPGVTATAVLSLALGIGVSASVFSVADAVLFRPLAVAAPHQLHSFRAIQTVGAATKIAGLVDDETFARMRTRADFAQVAGTRLIEDVAMGGAAEAAGMRAELVSAEYFDVLGLSPIHGSLPAGGDLGAVAISERLWRQSTGGDATIVGRAATVNGRPVIIAGVVRSFRGVHADTPADIFLPLAATALLDAAGETGIRLLFRIREDVPLPVAADRAAALFRASSTGIIPGARLRIELPSAEHGVSETRTLLRQPLALGLALAAILLVVASANAGGLLLTQFAARRGEIGIRIAIGAGRGRLARQLLVEAFLLAALAASAGLATALVGGPLLVSSIPSAAPLDYDLRMDWRVVTFTAAIAAIAAVIAASASVFRLLQADPGRLLTSESRTIVASGRRATRVLLTAQVACTLLLLTGATAVTRTLINLRSVPTGFAADDLFAIDLDVTRERAAGGTAAIDYLARLLDRVSAVPGVASATAAQFGLMVSGATTGTATIASFVPRRDEDRWVRMYFVGPRYFETLGMPLLLGRDIHADDRAGRHRVAVVNERFARFYFGSPNDAIGRMVNGDVQIVGVAADARYDTLRDEPARAMFVPFTQAPPRSRMTLLVRAAGHRQASIGAVVAALRDFDSGSNAKVTTGDSWISGALARERFVAGLAVVLSVLAVFLACAGVYAAVSNAVAERCGEIAVRMALGASRGAIVRFVLADPIRTTLVGITAGVPLLLLLMPSIAWLLFEVPPTDIVSVTLCGIALVTVATLAAALPAIRAARIDPIVALRNS